MLNQPLTEEEFLNLAPLYQGYWAYRLGCRQDSIVQNETNPYPLGSFESKEWNRGQVYAVYNPHGIDGA